MKSKVESLASALAVAQRARNRSPEPQGFDTDGYLKILVPELELGPARAASDSDRLQFNGTIPASITWKALATQVAGTSKPEFDDLLVARADGVVVWQRDNTAPRVGNLNDLYAAEATDGWWSPDWEARTNSAAVKQSAPSPPALATLRRVTFGGQSKLLVVQPVTLNGLSIGSSIVDAPSVPQLYVAGLVSRDALYAQARHVPLAWVVAFLLPVVVLFLALPFVKLATLTSKERYSLSDLVLLMVGAVAAAGLGAVVPFMSVSTQATEDAELAAVATRIERQLQREVRTVLTLTDLILQKERTFKESPGEACTAGRIPNMKCGLWEQLRALVEPATPHGEMSPMGLELDVAIWVDSQGTQTQKWTTKRQVTGPTSHRSLEHFRDLVSHRTWTVDERPQGFTIEPMRRLPRGDWRCWWVARCSRNVRHNFSC